MKRRTTLVALALMLAAALPGFTQEQAAPAPKAARPSRKKPLAKLPLSQMVNLNKASKESLGKLKGVTAPMAAQIVAMRPYRTKSELVTKLVLPRAVYEVIKHQVYAGQ
jgi:DNA uptake protein ComE-like DNA-binding protein